jgi:hypothetical protein
MLTMLERAQDRSHANLHRPDFKLKRINAMKHSTDQHPTSREISSLNIQNPVPAYSCVLDVGIWMFPECWMLIG